MPRLLALARAFFSYLFFRLFTAKRVSAAAAVAVALIAAYIPTILNSQQQEALARNSTIEYYNSVFDSYYGKFLEEIAAEGEIFIWKKTADLKIENNALPERDRESERVLTQRADKAWSTHLRSKYGESEIRNLAIFLLKNADLVYECSHFYEIFEDISFLDGDFARGALKGFGRFTDTPQGYLDILQDFLEGFWSSSSMEELQCHRESIIKVFGHRFSEGFWYMRHFLYCDKFIVENYFRERYSDASPLYRLESISMASEQADLEFRYPDKHYAVMRTLMQSQNYKRNNLKSITFNFRLNLKRCNKDAIDTPLYISTPVDVRSERRNAKGAIGGRSQTWRSSWTRRGPIRIGPLGSGSRILWAHDPARRAAAFKAIAGDGMQIEGADGLSGSMET